jgi:hypothetical protein
MLTDSSNTKPLWPRSARRTYDGFSCRTFTLRTVLRQVAVEARAASFAARMMAQESSRDVSDPTRGPRTLTPGPVRGSLTSRLLVMETTHKLSATLRAIPLVTRPTNVHHNPLGNAD